MKVYIQKGADGECSNLNSFVALDGFRHLGWEICTYKDIRILTENNPEDTLGRNGRIKRLLRLLKQVKVTVGCTVKRLHHKSINILQD